MIEFETEVTEVIRRTYNVKSFRFRKNADTEFKAGQFFFVTIKIGDAERIKHFSFSNSPTETEYIEFTKKLTSSEYSQALDRLEAGGWAKLKMPLGSFTYDGKYRKIAFLSGGIGITPIRSICKYVVDKRLDSDMVLLYGNRTADDIVFKEDFEEMQTNWPKLKVVQTLSDPGPGWRGRQGHISSRMIKEEIPDFMERKFYICGPPGMVGAMKEILLNELKIGSEHIITENFTGY